MEEKKVDIDLYKEIITELYEFRDKVYTECTNIHSAAKVCEDFWNVEHEFSNKTMEVYKNTHDIMNEIQKLSKIIANLEEESSNAIAGIPPLHNEYNGKKGELTYMTVTAEGIRILNSYASSLRESNENIINAVEYMRIKTGSVQNRLGDKADAINACLERIQELTIKNTEPCNYLAGGLNNVAMAYQELNDSDSVKPC